jgi:hypothetical protein
LRVSASSAILPFDNGGSIQGARSAFWAFWPEKIGTGGGTIELWCAAIFLRYAPGPEFKPPAPAAKKPAAQQDRPGCFQKSQRTGIRPQAQDQAVPAHVPFESLKKSETSHKTLLLPNTSMQGF